MNPYQPWTHDRPVRNANPGDLRPRSDPPAWPGQDELDTGEGGPFARFVTPTDGWAALALWCLDARYIRGLRTAAQMIAVFAPPTENDTKAYVAGIVLRMGAGTLELSRADTLEILCRAIAHWEDSKALWLDREIVSGVRLGILRWPTYRAERLGATTELPPPSKELTTDQLNEAELNQITDEGTA